MGKQISVPPSSASPDSNVAGLQSSEERMTYVQYSLERSITSQLDEYSPVKMNDQSTDQKVLRKRAGRLTRSGKA